MEIWKPIPEYSGVYEVSNLGNVKSLHGSKSKILKPSFDAQDRHQVKLCKDGVCKSRKVHKLVAQMFLNHIPCGFIEVVDHIDGNRKNNDVSNLRLTTQRLNSSNRKGSSKYVGVSWIQKSERWLASIQINGENKHLGYYDCELAASTAYQNAVKELKQKG